MEPSSEFTFLAACCRRTFTANSGALRLPDADALNWDRLLRLARYHRVQGLLWKGLGSASSRIPPKIADELASDARMIAAYNLRVAAECGELAQGFAERGIDVLFIKGLTLAKLAYGDCMAKSGSDIDILIDPDRLRETTDLLAKRGYRSIEPGPATPPAALSAWHEFCKESLWGNAAGLKVDLHTQLADSPRLIPAIGPNSSRQSVEIAGGAHLPTLGDEELFAYLVVHGASCAWFRLKWLTDFAAFANRLGPAKLDAFYRRSVELGAGRAAAQALLLADRVYDLLEQAPDLAAKLAKDGVNQWLADAAFDQVAGEREPVEPTERRLGTARMHYTQLALIPGPRFVISEVIRKAGAFIRRIRF
ncbi:MAG: nucleotidyltransferase family protein [Pseudomonadota bacterium]